ncbi:putative 3-phenylpropionic acid transporter domain protein, partial [Candidatus Erwinia dacicola]
MGCIAMLGGMMLRPAVMPLGTQKQLGHADWAQWKQMLAENAVWLFLMCVMLMQGAHAIRRQLLLPVRVNYPG